MLDAASREEAVGIFKGMQWAWDKRKTKPDTEERSIQEAVKLVVDGVNAALMDKIHEEGWEEDARSFGKNVRTVCDMMDALECGWTWRTARG
jgi:ribonuclease HI